jgi:putative ABC transport system substrate-binding protein
VAVLAWNTPDAATLPAGRGATDRMIAETRAAGQQMGVDVSPAIVADAGELPKALAPITRDRVQAVIVQNNSIMFENRAQILSVFSRERLPAMYEGRDYTDDGGLISYGPDVRDNFRRAADYVDKILKGARPGDLAIQQPSKLELVINLKAAKALGIAIPQSLLLRAEVIQ